MQALVGLFLFSVLLTSGASLECETCFAQENSCSNPQKQSCPSNLNTCLTVVGEATVEGKTYNSTLKSCYLKEACDLLKSGMSFNISEVAITIKDFTIKDIMIKEVTCNKAPSPSASLLLGFSGLLLLKILFWCVS